jgi:protein subunit release factor B
MTTIATPEPPPGGKAAADSSRGGGAKQRQRRKEPIIIDEADLVEKFVRGSGPGGQSVNKSKNNVQLRHIPSGITAECHEQRELASNRRIARKLLRDKLDLAINGVHSRLGVRQQKERRRKRKASSRAKKKYGGGSPEEEEEETDDSGTASTALKEDAREIEDVEHSLLS